MSQVRVRFAPSPTGGLHIGGLRTALFNYLFAKNQGGKFILRIEDTDQNRFVEGAEKYIQESLAWAGISPDEGPEVGGDFGPYRQSERKELYRKYVDKLLNDGNAYYAFDTTEELDMMRERLKKSRVTNPQYDSFTRNTMKNSLTLTKEEVDQKLKNGEPYVIRVKIPEKEEVRLQDIVRGWVMVHTEVLDDKVLMKSDGMPTYHLANVVDDYLMKITHVIRGEEWLPSAPLHVLLYQLLGLEDSMPQFAHLPLILKPDGNGKLSKRAADKAGFPIFPLSWTEKGSEAVSEGFKEIGFLPNALVNFLAFLGWNPGTEQELFSLDELIKNFSLERINKAGTKFDFDKAKWFNQEYIKANSDEFLAKDLLDQLWKQHEIKIDVATSIALISLLKERVTFPVEFVEKSLTVLLDPRSFDTKVVKKKWSLDSNNALTLFQDKLESADNLNTEEIKNLFWNTLESNGFKPGQHMQTLRLVLTGEGSGPDLMSIITILSPKKAAERIKKSISLLTPKADI